MIYEVINRSLFCSQSKYFEVLSDFALLCKLDFLFLLREFTAHDLIFGEQFDQDVDELSFVWGQDTSVKGIVNALVVPSVVGLAKFQLIMVIDVDDLSDNLFVLDLPVPVPMPRDVKYFLLLIWQVISQVFVNEHKIRL